MQTKHNWITTPVTADLLRGALDLEHTAHGVLPRRLPARARAQCAGPVDPARISELIGSLGVRPPRRAG